MSSNLSGEEENKLMTVLKTHRKAFGYSMKDLKGISPSIAFHRIFLGQGAQPVAELQRRLKPQMKEVVRNNLYSRCRNNLSCESKCLGKFGPLCS
jgi:hypothetical protein